MRRRTRRTRRTSKGAPNPNLLYSKKDVYTPKPHQKRKKDGSKQENKRRIRHSKEKKGEKARRTRGSFQKGNIAAAGFLFPSPLRRRRVKVK
jgi:hypothetical protein